jgi:MFS family permease
MRAVNILMLFNAFFGGAFLVVIPLLLVENDVNITEIGIIFSVLPLIFTSLRINFAYVSDRIGRKGFFVLNAASRLLTNLIYYFSSSAMFFLIGKIMEGISNASFWSVNRAELYKNPGKRAKMSSYLLALNSIGDGTGRLLAGFLIAYITFSNTLLVLVLLAALLFIPASTFKNEKGRKKKPTTKDFLSSVKFILKERSFMRIASVFGYFAVFNALVLTFVLPIFLAEKAVNYENIGLFLAMLSLLTGLFTIRLVNRFDKINMNSIVFKSLILLVIPLSIFPFVDNVYFLFLLMFMLGVGNGYVNIVWEYLTVKAVEKSNLVSFDIGMLFMPHHIVRFVALLVSGFIIQYLGYVAIFWISIVFVIIFSIKSRKLILELS